MIIRRIKRRIAKIEFIQKAVHEGADLSSFREKPALKVYIGLIIIGFSYLLGWPAVVFFAILSVYFKEPLILIVGGPLIYGMSHLLFLIGMYVAGSRYVSALFRWAARVMFEDTIKEDQYKNNA